MGMSTTPPATTIDPQRTVLILRVLNGDQAAAHLWFQASVLDRYREQGPETFRVMRTRSVGRVRAAGNVWSMDFGISEDETLIHTSVQELTGRLPEGERRHWAQHAATLPTSRNFMTMKLSPGACIDDGDVHDW